MKKSIKILIVSLCIATGLGTTVFGGYQYLKKSGEAQLKAAHDTSKIAMNKDKDKAKKVELKENQVRYQDQTYELKEDVYNILVMGIDTAGEVKETTKIGKAGQADTLFLVTIDNKDRKVTMLNIDRDTMSNISILDYFGNFSHKQKQQIALSYAYGNSKEDSARLTCEAVSELLYGMPIHGYCAINTSAIPIINDAVGGVTVTLLDDFTSMNANFTAGSTQLLLGENASNYIRSRQGVGDGTNVSRMARQKQYMEAFIQSAIKATKEDITTPVRIFQAITPYMVTNITLNQVTYLASSALDYAFSNSQMKNLPGSMGSGQLYNEFHVDDTKLYEMILEVFYNKI